MTARSLDIPLDEPRKDFKGSARPIEVSDKDISRFRSIVSAPIKGMAKSVVGLGKLALDFFGDPNRIFRSVTDPVIRGAEEKIEERIPTQPEYLEKSLERGGGLVLPAVLAAATGGGSILGAGASSLAGGFAGQAVEEAGGGPILQGLAEIGPSALPRLARKIIPSSADQARILGMGRKFGMTEEQLAPLMPEAAKRRFFGKFAYSGEGAQEALQGTKKGIQNIYQALETGPQAQQLLSPQATNQFIQDVNNLAKRMPHNIRSQLKQDAADLVSSARQKGGFVPEDLMNFYHDVSSRYNLGRPQLELFKGPIKDAIRSVDPHLASDFETVNRMYQKSIQIGRVLRPSEYEHLISLGEAYELGASVAKLDPGRLTRLLGVVGFRKFSEKMLTSPRLQNMIKKTQDAVIKNQLPIIKRMGELIQEEFREDQE